MFGKRIEAIKVIYAMQKEMNEVMKDRILYANKITLFLIDENCRGLGIDKKLMDNYMKYYKVFFHFLLMKNYLDLSSRVQL